MAKLNQDGLGNLVISMTILGVMIVLLLLSFLFLEDEFGRFLAVICTVGLGGVIMVATWTQNFSKQLKEFYNGASQDFKKTYLKEE